MRGGARQVVKDYHQLLEEIFSQKQSKCYNLLSIIFDDYGCWWSKAEASEHVNLICAQIPEPCLMNSTIRPTSRTTNTADFHPIFSVANETESGPLLERF